MQKKSEEGTSSTDKECTGTNILASTPATPGPEFLGYIIPDHADGLVGPDHGEQELHNVLGGPGHGCCLSLLS